MMLSGAQYGLVIVPTIALGDHHQEAFERLQVKSIFLNGSSRKPDYEAAFNISTPEASRPSVIILMPETLFGTENTRGVLDKLAPARLQFIALDEVHLVLEWATFRGAFSEIKKLKDLFPCPLLALTATIKPVSLQLLLSSVLRNAAGNYSADFYVCALFNSIAFYS